MEPVEWNHLPAPRRDNFLIDQSRDQRPERGAVPLPVRRLSLQLTFGLVQLSLRGRETVPATTNIVIAVEVV